MWNISKATGWKPVFRECYIHRINRLMWNEGQDNIENPLTMDFCSFSFFYVSFNASSWICCWTWTWVQQATHVKKSSVEPDCWSESLLRNENWKCGCENHTHRVDSTTMRVLIEKKEVTLSNHKFKKRMCFFSLHK